MGQTTKTEKLENLFERWERSIPGYKGKFVKDGILNEFLYDRAPLKILYLMKEPNNPEQKPGDFREWWKDEIRFLFTYRLAEWSYGILNDFPPYDDVWTDVKATHQALLHTSLMNIKKIGGAGSSKYSEIDSHLIKCHDYLKEQIEITDPEIIILGMSFWTDLRDKLFPDAKWSSSGYGIEIGKFKKAKVIDYYHPSSRTPPAAAYSLLQNVIKSEKFQLL